MEISSLPIPHSPFDISFPTPVAEALQGGSARGGAEPLAEALQGGRARTGAEPVVATRGRPEEPTKKHPAVAGCLVKLKTVLERKGKEA